MIYTLPESVYLYIKKLGPNGPIDMIFSAPNLKKKVCVNGAKVQP